MSITAQLGGHCASTHSPIVVVAHSPRGRCLLGVLRHLWWEPLDCRLHRFTHTHTQAHTRRIFSLCVCVCPRHEERVFVLCATTTEVLRREMLLRWIVDCWWWWTWIDDHITGNASRMVIMFHKTEYAETLTQTQEENTDEEDGDTHEQLRYHTTGDQRGCARQIKKKNYFVSMLALASL